MRLGATAGRVGLIPGARFALRQNVYPIVNVLAAVVMVFSITMLVPLVLALARRDDGMPGFVTSAAVCFVGGLGALARDPPVPARDAHPRRHHAGRARLDRCCRPWVRCR